MLRIGRADMDREWPEKSKAGFYHPVLRRSIFREISLQF